jgi:hypothetical protein
MLSNKIAHKDRCISKKKRMLFILMLDYYANPDI